MTMKRKWSAYLSVFLSILVSGSAFAGLAMPEQFKSDNAAVILGLDQNPRLAAPDARLTKEDIDSAHKVLIFKWHPDRFGDASLYSEKDKLIATEISKKINDARDKLKKYIQMDSAYNPRVHASTRPRARDSNSSKKSAKSDYTWHDNFHEEDGRRNRGTNANYHADKSMNGTMFDILQEHPDFEQAFISLEVDSVSLNQETDAVMVINRGSFPKIEIQFISKSRDGAAPQLVKSIFGTYVRGYHRGAYDAIVLEDGNYLINPFQAQSKKPFVATAMEQTSGRKLILKPNLFAGFIEMSPTGYSAGRMFRSRAKNLETAQPGMRPPESKEAAALHCLMSRLKLTPE